MEHAQTSNKAVIVGYSIDISMRNSIIISLLMLAFVLPGTSLAATLSVSPASGTYTVGDIITIRVIASSNSPLNAVSSSLAFPSSIFSIQSVSKNNSILNFWVAEPGFSRSAGTVQFEGVSLSGYQGNSGTVVTIALRALRVGTGTIAFQNGQVLANDGQGTDITAGLSGATFVIEAAKEKTTPPPKPVVEEPKEENIPEESVPSTPVLAAPQIALKILDGKPTVTGTSQYSNANVLLLFTPVEGSKIFITGGTDGIGNFSLVVPDALRDGAYAVHALIVFDDGRQSVASNVLTVEVGGLFVGEISWKTATYLSIIIILLLLAMLAYDVWHRHFAPKHMHREVHREVKEAQSTLRKTFALLKQDITGKFTKAQLKKDLSEAEEIIQKEIDDIDNAGAR